MHCWLSCAASGLTAGRARLGRWTLLAGLLVFGTACTTLADIPATPLMTLYRFNGALDLPYFAVDQFGSAGPGAPAGTLVQGTTVIPCLVLRDGRPLVDASGTPYVGFDIIGDPRTADALDLLEEKWLAEGGWPAEKRYYKTSETIELGNDFLDWGGTSKRRMNPWVTTDAVGVMKAAGRLEL